MFRKLLKSKIHRATVTRSDLNYEGSIAVDADLLKAADIQPFEAVHIWNVTNGSRLQTYALAVDRGTGEICLNGAAARLAQAGDLVIIASFAWLDEKEAANASPKLVFVDGKNRILETTEPLKKS
jgi:aspartate 1-decarboxylase